MATIGWARISTTEQSLNDQVAKLNEAGCTKIFKGQQSGKSVSNEAKLQELLDYVRDGDTVVVTKLDRLGRSLKVILNLLAQLSEKGVSVKVLDQNIDTGSTDPMQKAMVHLLGLFSELEHSIIVSRLQEGQKAANKFGGRPCKLSDADKAELIKKFNDGISKSKLALEFGVSRATVLDIISKAA